MILSIGLTVIVLFALGRYRTIREPIVLVAIVVLVVASAWAWWRAYQNGWGL